MATNRQQMLSTLGEVLQAVASWAGGSVPATQDREYQNWISWANQAQEDAATRGFWSRLLAHTELEITTGDDTVDLPDNFHKRNGIFMLLVDGTDWSDNTVQNDQGLFVNLNPVTGVWQVRFLGYVPTADATGELWYYYLPPKLVLPSDPIFLDGKMLAYYILAEYYRQAERLGSLDDARAEYNNRFIELLNLEQLPTRQDLVSFTSHYGARGQSPSESEYYGGRRTRRW